MFYQWVENAWLTPFYSLYSKVFFLQNSGVRRGRGDQRFSSKTNCYIQFNKKELQLGSQSQSFPIKRGVKSFRNVLIDVLQKPLHQRFMIFFFFRQPKGVWVFLTEALTLNKLSRNNCVFLEGLLAKGFYTLNRTSKIIVAEWFTELQGLVVTKILFFSVFFDFKKSL